MLTLSSAIAGTAVAAIAAASVIASVAFLLIFYLDDLGKDNGTISKEIKIPAFAVGKLKDQSKMFSIEVLLSMVEACAKTDELIKTGKINDRVGVELILIQFSQN